jgi:transposase
MTMTCWQLEWIGYAEELEENAKFEMVDLYRFLSRWRLKWVKLEQDPTLRVQVSSEARDWAKKVQSWAKLN